LQNNFIEAEQSIAFLLGLHCCYLAHGTYASHDESENKRFLHSMLFSSGINKDAVLKEMYVFLKNVFQLIYNCQVLSM